MIAGPTASGKSALALELARHLNGVIINTDSMQLYADLRIVTARPSKDDMRYVPHRLYGVLPADRMFSTGDWLGLVRQELAHAHEAGRMPILVGGTGLYFKTLTEGLAQMPQIRPEIRAACRALAETQGKAGVLSALKPLDPEAAETLQDLQRLTRALEVAQSTGHPLSYWQQTAQADAVLNPSVCQKTVLAPPRSWLHERIALRSRSMVTDEGISEVKALLERQLPDSLPAMRAIGVREIAALLCGDADHEETVYRLTVSTRQYAKRQETWFRNQMADWLRIDPSTGGVEVLADNLLKA